MDRDLLPQMKRCPPRNPTGAAPQSVHPAKRGERRMGHRGSPVLIAGTTECNIRNSLNNPMAG